MTRSNSTIGNSVKNCISVVFLFVEGLVQVALRKVIVIYPLLEHFKVVLYERSWSFPSKVEYFNPLMPGGNKKVTHT